jgi:hypothetical protein
VAFTTFAILKARPGEAEVQGFFDRLPDTFGAADEDEGFVGRSIRDPVAIDRAAVVGLARRAAARVSRRPERDAERDGILRALKAGVDRPRPIGDDDGASPSARD